MWKKSPHPLVSDADIVSLLNASSSHSSFTSERNNYTSSSSAGVRTFSNSSKPSSKVRNVPSLDKNRTTKQSLKMFEMKSLQEQLELILRLQVLLFQFVSPSQQFRLRKHSWRRFPHQLYQILSKRNEFETLEAKPQVPPPLGNFMEDEHEEDDDHDDESNDGGEDDNDSLSDFVAIAAAAQTGSSQILSATKNILSKNVTSKAPPPAAKTTTSASSSSKAPVQPSSSSYEPLTKNISPTKNRHRRRRLKF